MEREIAHVKHLYPKAVYVGIADGAQSNWDFLEPHTCVQILDFYQATGYGEKSIDFLPTAHRDKKAALCFLKKAVRHHGLPEKITIDQSGANTAAIEALVEETSQKIEIRQNKYLNNLVEQDHRAVKRIVRPMLGFKSFRSASLTLGGIELMHMLKKGQLIAGNSHSLSAAGQFYSLAA
jgi:putative transposase